LKPLWVTPLAISSVAAEQNGKKQGKGIVNRRDGFVSVADESDLYSVIIKDLSAPKPFAPIDTRGDRAFKNNRN
jgi:hypothetical protein